MIDNSSKAVHRSDYRQPPYWIESVDLDFDLHETKTRVKATIDFQSHANEPAEHLKLDGEKLNLIRIALDGRELDADEYTLDEESLTLHDPPDRFQLVTEVEINPENNSALTGLYRSSGNFCTQCEAMGFRRITYFLDRPDVMARYRVAISADKQQYPVLLSNGNRINAKDLSDGRHQVTWEDPYPKPSYLFALVAGDLRSHTGSFTTASGRDVKLEIWVEPQNIDLCEHALQSLITSMKWDEDVFGLEYDLDVYMIVAVNDFNMGAMENKGLNVFNSKYVLARPDTATDADYELVEGVIAHEYFHNWTGNRVTCRDWFQLTLKEGLTVFRDQQFTADTTSDAVKRIADVISLRTRQFPEDDGPMAHPIRPESYISMDNFYTATVYNKGAEVIRMYHTLLGAAGFRKGMDLYFQRHDNSAVTCDDFRAAMADANNVDLEQFGRWYSQAGTPQIAVKTNWDPKRGEMRLDFTQGYPKPKYEVPGTKDRKPLHIPVAVGFLSAEGSDESVTCVTTKSSPQTNHLIELTEESQSFVFAGFQDEPIPSILRGFSAPVELQTPVSQRQLAFRMSHDCDPFNRWDACRRLATHLLLAMAANMKHDRPMHLAPVFVEAFGSLIVDTTIDGSFKSLLLSLPSESMLGQEMDVCDPDAIHAARQYMVAHLASNYRSQLFDLYRTMRRDEPYRNDVASVQRRRLKNSVLELLTSLEDEETIALAAKQFQTANNMTDQQSALVFLCDVDVPERVDAIRTFYEQWKGYPLVVDKWFSVQANSSLPSTVDDVVSLSRHADFNFSNPNRIRALAGAFGSNQLRFHSKDGAGYAFVADVVMQVDISNPQVAARLVSSFNQWKRFDLDRQDLMKTQLNRIRSKEGLSKDVDEILSRALES